ncbi:MAG: ATP-dependent Clp protease proteolytic subunit, partial [Rhodoferax sp.]
AQAGTFALLLRFWRGEDSLRNIVLKGGALAFFWFMLIFVLMSGVTDQANYTGAYKLRQWGAVILTALSPLGALWWSVALMRCGLQRHKAGSSMLTSLAAFVLGVCVMVQTATSSFGMAGEWVSGWWRTVHDDLQVTEVLHNPHLGRIVLRGEIGFGSLVALEKAINTKPTLTLLEVESPGGYAVEGLAMARLIEKHKLDTVSLGQCASACTLLLVAGQERYLGPEAKVGFHRSWSYAGGFGNGWNRTDYAIADFYSARNTADAFIKTALDTPGYRLWFPTAGQMFDAGYATKRWDERKSGY